MSRLLVNQLIIVLVSTHCQRTDARCCWTCNHLLLALGPGPPCKRLVLAQAKTPTCLPQLAQSFQGKCEAKRAFVSLGGAMSSLTSRRSSPARPQPTILPCAVWLALSMFPCHGTSLAKLATCPMLRLSPSPSRAPPSWHPLPFPQLTAGLPGGPASLRPLLALTASPAHQPSGQTPPPGLMPGGPWPAPTMHNRRTCARQQCPCCACCWGRRTTNL